MGIYHYLEAQNWALRSSPKGIAATHRGIDPSCTQDELRFEFSVVLRIFRNSH
ncbi:MAG: hypothetical protein AAFY41_06200 [Bacteroidota bacterium]